MNKYYLFLLLALISFKSVCQKQTDSTYYFFNRTTPEKKILHKIKKLDKKTEIDYYKLVYHSKQRNSDSILNYINVIEKKNQLPEKLSAKFIYFKAYYNRIIQNDSTSFRLHNEALKKAEQINDSLTVLFSLVGLAQSYDYEEDQPYRLDFLNRLNETSELYNNNSFKIISSFLMGNYYLFRDNSKKSISYYKKTLENNFSSLDSSILVGTYSNLGALYNEVIDNQDSAILYYDKKIALLKNNIKFQNERNYFSTYLNLASAYRNNKEYDKAISFLKKADSIEVNENVLSKKLTIRESLAQTFEAKEDYKSAINNYKAYDSLKTLLNRDELKKGIAKYENQELRIKNLELEAEDAKKRTLLLSALGFIIFGSIVFLLIQKNTKKKQKLAEQEKEIETQKLATVLKEQELNAIDAIIEGQEKERQRIANDLHDDLGGLMATVKLHFNALKDKKSPELFNKTNSLIDEAYNKVRSVAHAKNSGVIAKHGLLKSIKEMANKISISNKLSIDVIDYGLDSRLENSLELTIFRITQELVSNAIKHAEASEITIHLTNHEDSINLMVEDNGKGFDTSQITKTAKGMGIGSIDKRVEHLDGKMTIESKKNKGTTVIIDIPL